MIKMGSYLLRLCIGMGMILVIVPTTVIQSRAIDAPAESHKIEFEYIKQEDPPRAAVDMPPRTHDIQIYTETEKDELMRIAMAEAGNQTEDGMWLVMSVVLNRVNSEDFPDSIDKVLHQKGAFSAVSNGSYDRAEPTEECERAFERISSGDVAPQIIAFEGKRSDVLDQYFLYAFTHKDHKFYTKK